MSECPSNTVCRGTCEQHTPIRPAPEPADQTRAAEVETGLDSMHDLARTYRLAGDEYLRRAEAAEATVARVRALAEPAWRANRGHEYDATTEAFAAGRNEAIDDLRAALDGER